MKEIKIDENKIILKKNMQLLLHLQLALESYGDDNDGEILLLKNAYKDLDDLRKNREIISVEQQIKLSNAIIEKFNNVLDLVGRNNFIFYEDGDINYIWKRTRKNG